MKKTKIIFAVLASLFLGACSSDNSDNKQPSYTETAQTEAPAWLMDWSNNQERPDWTEPDFPSIYENWTVMKVQIEKTLEPYTSEGDLLALFVNGELRGLAGPAVIVGSDQVDNGKFVLKVWGNETDNETVNMSLQYYNQTLKHVFTLSEDISMNSDETTQRLRTRIHQGLCQVPHNEDRYRGACPERCGTYPRRRQPHRSIRRRRVSRNGDALARWHHPSHHLRAHRRRIGNAEILRRR